MVHGHPSSVLRHRVFCRRGSGAPHGRQLGRQGRSDERKQKRISEKKLQQVACGADKTIRKMAAKISTTVIVPTYNGAHKILNVLKALEQQSIRPDEVLVVVDGSTDHTVALLNQTEFDLPGFRLLEQANGGRAKVRNFGAAEARGEMLIFFDDDMLPAPDCLAVHLRHHAQQPGSILTGAQIDLSGAERTELQQYKSHCSIKW